MAASFSFYTYLKQRISLASNKIFCRCPKESFLPIYSMSVYNARIKGSCIEHEQ